jgi:hypothetical protein
MGVTRLVPAFIFSLLVGAQFLLPSPSFARCCTCGMSCPQGTFCTCCCCTPSCATDDTGDNDVSYKTVFNDRPLKVRGLREYMAVLEGLPEFRYVLVRNVYGLSASAMRLDTIPAGDLRFQCEHFNWLSEMLSAYQGKY